MDLNHKLKPKNVWLCNANAIGVIYGQESDLWYISLVIIRRLIFVHVQRYSLWVFFFLKHLMLLRIDKKKKAKKKKKKDTWCVISIYFVHIIHIISTRSCVFFHRHLTDGHYFPSVCHGGPRESKIDLRLSWQSVLGTDCWGYICKIVRIRQ
jgi:hypothetical protein